MGVGVEKAGTDLDKVKLGGSELKVTKLGIGAWSWGDTTYWNNFDWDGRFFSVGLALYMWNPSFVPFILV